MWFLRVNTILNFHILIKIFKLFKNLFKNEFKILGKYYFTNWEMLRWNNKTENYEFMKNKSLLLSLILCGFCPICKITHLNLNITKFLVNYVRFYEICKSGTTVWFNITAKKFYFRNASKIDKNANIFLHFYTRTFTKEKH